eukprot:6990394-Alexandrium_andersonii.AAC.1
MRGHEMPGRFELDNLAACVQGQAEHEGHPEPPKVEGAPPSLPNVYTDGAIRPPQRPDRATSGI